MKNKKYYIYIIIVSIIIFIGLFSLKKKDNSNLILKEDIPIQILEKELDKNQKKIESINKNHITEKINNINVSLSVLNKNYSIDIENDSSVFDVMSKIKVLNDFDFKYTSHSSLGNFITEINGTKGEPGKYWIYYINDKKASVGVSKYIVSDGDIIRWNREGI